VGHGQLRCSSKRGIPLIRTGSAGRTAGTLLVLLSTAFLQLSCALFIADPPASGLDVPDHYRDATSTGPGPARDWWRSFASQELTALVEQALAANHNIAAAVARIQEATAQLHVTSGLLLPSGGVTGTNGVGRVSPSGADIGSPVPLPVQRVWNVTIAASYQVDFWGQNAARILAAKRTELASRFDREVVELSIVASVINTYFQILTAQDRLRIANDNVRVAMRVRNVVKQRVDAGSSTTVDLAQQDYIVAQQRMAIPVLTQTLRQNTVALATLLGEMPMRVSVRGGGLGSLVLPEVLPGLPSALLLQRPDIREAEAALAVTSANLASARVALLPSIQLTGSAGYESFMLKTLITPQAALYQVAAGVTQPIFDLPNLLGQIELQNANQREYLERYRQTVIQSFTDVEQALIAIQETAEQERLTRRSVAIAREGYGLMETQLSGGYIDLTTMLNTQQSLFQSLDNLAQVRSARFQASVALYQALGGGWTAEPLPSLLPDVPNPSPPPSGASDHDGHTGR
jgi:outer membrane protein, multidrug efflux system